MTQNSHTTSGLRTGQVTGYGSGMGTGQGTGMGTGQGTGMGTGQGTGMGSGSGVYQTRTSSYGRTRRGESTILHDQARIVAENVYEGHMVSETTGAKRLIGVN